MFKFKQWWNGWQSEWKKEQEVVKFWSNKINAFVVSVSNAYNGSSSFNI